MIAKKRRVIELEAGAGEDDEMDKEIRKWLKRGYQITNEGETGDTRYVDMSSPTRWLY